MQAGVAADLTKAMMKMTQAERRMYLIKSLLAERQDYLQAEIPQGEQDQKELLRALFNIRPPQPVSDAFLKIQDCYLQWETAQKGVVDADDLTAVQQDIYIWQGDITTLKCDAIVNAANSRLLGCFCPCHGCIDNAIHTFSGVQLRLACAALMEKQGHEEPAGRAKLTPAYNLPCRYVLHTVGPLIQGALTKADCESLASCYRSCLALAEENGVRSMAFCCISTGEFHFPNDRAAAIAVQAVREYKQQTRSGMKVIFNVFKEADLYIYRELLE